MTDDRIASNARMIKVREKLREQERKGQLGVIAAKSAVAEGKLYSWMRNPVYALAADELSRVEGVLDPLGDTY